MVSVKIHDASMTSMPLFQTPTAINDSTTFSTSAPQPAPALPIQTSMSTSSLTNFNTRLLDNNNNNTKKTSSSSLTRRVTKNDTSSTSSPTSFEASLIQMHRFFKEQKIYTDPNDNYKRRTVVLIRSHAHSGNHGANSNSRNKSR